MKKHLLILFMLQLGYAASAQTNKYSLSVSLNFYVDNACSQPGVGLGYILSSAQGGTPPYTYDWSNGTTSDMATNLIAGTYTLTVTDFLGATATASQAIADISQGTFNAIQVTMPTLGLNNGTFDIAGYPGTDYDVPLNFNYYNMTSGSGFNHIVNVTHYDFVDSVAPGEWIIDLTTASGCTGEVTLQVDSYPDFLPYITTTDACMGSPTGACVFHANPQGPLPQLNFVSTVPPTAFITLNMANNLSYTLLDSATNVILVHHTAALNNVVDSVFNYLAPGNYVMLMAFTHYNNSTFNTDTLYSRTTNFTINSTANCGIISGKIFSDMNNDCIYNSGDVDLPNVIVEFTPGGYLANTDANGNYATNIPYGTYSITQHSQLAYTQKCPSAGYTFTLDTINTTAVADISDSIDFTPDGVVDHGAATAARPGFDVIYSLLTANNSPNNASPAIVTFNFDPSLTFVSSGIPYTTLTPGQLTFDLDTLVAFQHSNIHVTFNVPSSATIGDTLYSSLSLSAATGETNLTNNSDSYYILVTGAFDPNEKSVIPGGDIQPNTDLNYTIRFQNTGNDTAFTVTVIDTISPLLDITSIQPGASSHPYTYDFTAPNVVRFKFNNILLPDSNQNEALSHGFVNYRISQQANNLPGALIENTAGIYFDFNAPVMTNTTQSLVQPISVGLNTSSKIPFTIFPNPVNDFLQIKFDEKAANVQLELINSIGGSVIKKSVQITYPGCILNWNLSKLASGIYTVKVSNDEKTFSQHISKQ